MSADGNDPADQPTCDGRRAHLRLCGPGVIAAASLAPANADEMAVAAADRVDAAAGGRRGERHSWRPQAAARLRERDLAVVAPDTWAARDPHPWPQWRTDTRRRSATSSGQLPERFHAKNVRARDAWHRLSRW